MLTNVKRAFHFAVQDFYRNRGMSIAAIFVLTITILLATGLFFIQGVNHYLIDTIQSKIDITAYFKQDTAESDILQVKQGLLKEAPEIKSIEYISKDQALADFTQKHQGDQVFSQALQEVGDNPFLPSLNITTTPSSDQYQKIANILSKDQYAQFIQKVDFSEKKDTIDKVFAITSAVNNIGIGLAILLVLIVILVVFNTIKLIVDASKEEIATMRIVGASSWFVRAPFVIEGGLFGCVAFAICFVITLLAAYFLSAPLAIIMPGFSLFRYFLSNIFLIILLQLVVGAGLGGLSSYIVVRKYLKV